MYAHKCTRTSVCYRLFPEHGLISATAPLLESLFQLLSIFYQNIISNRLRRGGPAINKNIAIKKMKLFQIVYARPDFRETISDKYGIYIQHLELLNMKHAIKKPPRQFAGLAPRNIETRVAYIETRLV